jgi:translation initiation factor IF-1
MAKQEPIEKDGTVVNEHPNYNFTVEFDNGKQAHCYCSGDIRNNKINILPGDRVKVELSPYDLEKGRITYRYNTGGGSSE